MEVASLVVEVLKYIGPAIVVLLGVKLVMDQQRKGLSLQQQSWVKAEVLKEHLPLKLAAYERVMLFLERINPEKLPFLVEPQSSVRAYHSVLSRQVQEEFEHNIAQQIYLSPSTWTAVVAAKDQVLELLGRTSAELANGENGQDFQKLWLANYREQERNMLQIAALMLKKDVGQIFGSEVQ